MQATVFRTIENADLPVLVLSKIPVLPASKVNGGTLFVDGLALGNIAFHPEKQTLFATESKQFSNQVFNFDAAPTTGPAFKEVTYVDFTNCAFGDAVHITYEIFGQGNAAEVVKVEGYIFAAGVVKVKLSTTIENTSLSSVTVNSLTITVLHFHPSGT